MGGIREGPLLIISCTGTQEEIAAVVHQVLEEGLKLIEQRHFCFEEMEMWMVSFEYEGKVL